MTPSSSNKIPPKRLFVQVAYKDLLEKFFLIDVFNINCEIYVRPDIIDSFEGQELNRVKARFDEKGIRSRIHAPIFNPYGDGFVILKESYLQGLRLCGMLGAKDVVMHAEYEADKFSSIDDWFSESIDIWGWIASSAEKHGIVVLIENHQEASPEAIVKILEHIKSPNLKACFDVGHFNIFSRADMVSLLGHYPDGSIGEVHLSDNNGDSDSHLTLGMGRIKFPVFFDALHRKGIDPVYTIEAKCGIDVVGGFWYLKKIGML